ncbi:MAG TPA: dethiobiotin synthase [Acidimicrobiia bacterium]|nr:dethiobiotin synthase [Acidimicrobiia bacterium]
MNVVAVAGTGTEIGKTYVAAGLLRGLRARGRGFTVYKPVQSFAPSDSSTDADVLAGAAGLAPAAVCPPHRWLPLPLAPPIAAEALGLGPFTIADLASETRARATGAPVLVETVGGVRSPIASDGDSAALIEALAPALVVLVADASLGTINLVRLSRDALWRQRQVVVFMNRFDERSDLHVRNAEWLVVRDGMVVLTDHAALVDLVEPLARP